MDRLGRYHNELLEKPVPDAAIRCRYWARYDHRDDCLNCDGTGYELCFGWGQGHDGCGGYAVTKEPDVLCEHHLTRCAICDTAITKDEHGEECCRTCEAKLGIIPPGRAA